ncbi:hypothetical protein VULLAG_LOCUS17851 [Vulpes lagopus]
MPVTQCACLKIQAPRPNPAKSRSIDLGVNQDGVCIVNKLLDNSDACTYGSHRLSSMVTLGRQHLVSSLWVALPWWPRLPSFIEEDTEALRRPGIGPLSHG